MFLRIYIVDTKTYNGSKIGADNMLIELLMVTQHGYLEHIPYVAAYRLSCYEGEHAGVVVWESCSNPGHSNILCP